MADASRRRPLARRGPLSSHAGCTNSGCRVTTQYRIDKDLTAQTKIDNQLLTEKVTTLSQSLTWNFDNCQFSLNGDIDSRLGYALGLSLSFSLAHDPAHDAWHMQRQGGQRRKHRHTYFPGWRLMTACMTTAKKPSPTPNHASIICRYRIRAGRFVYFASRRLWPVTVSISIPHR